MAPNCTPLPKYAMRMDQIGDLTGNLTNCGQIPAQFADSIADSFHPGGNFRS